MIWEKNDLSISGDTKIRVSIQKKVICIAHVHTKRVENLKFSHNVYFSTPPSKPYCSKPYFNLSISTSIKPYFNLIRSRYLVVHIRRDTRYKRRPSAYNYGLLIQLYRRTTYPPPSIEFVTRRQIIENSIIYFFTILLL